MTEKTSTAVVRPRDDSDLPACVEALSEVHVRDGYPVYWPADPASWLTTSTLIGAWVAELDGRVVGHVGLAGGTREATGEVNRLFVAPGARGRRIGELLLARVVAEARARELLPVLDVVSTDAPAIALYERLGWELLGMTDAPWAPPGHSISMRSYQLATR